MNAAIDQGDPWDPLHEPGTLVRNWSTDNAGEAAPGVLTPLSWTGIWRPVGDTGLRRAAYAVGAWSKEEAQPGYPPGDQCVRIFYGRIAQQMEYMALFGDRMPGTSGQETIAGLYGKVPEGMAFAPTKRRYPIIALRFPREILTAPRRVRAAERETEAWWRSETAGVRALDEASAKALFEEANRRFQDALTIHSIALMCVVQPLYQALAALVAKTGVGEPGILSGSGGAEMAIVEDIWRASRGQIDLDAVIANHGFHGPLEGELSSRVWREDPEPLRRMIGEYAARDESDDPFAIEGARHKQADRVRRDLLAALPAAQRLPTRAILRLAEKNIPLRGVGKRAFLEALDVARASARRLGELMAADGRLADAEDVFYLDVAELFGTLPPDVRDLVERRRRRRAEYQELEDPGSFAGVPQPVRREDAARAGDDGEPPVVTGLGVSAGVVEGTVRVVTDPAFAEVEPDEVLVAPTTDPSWASIMFVSSALVVDLGGVMSHAAVVARELGLPCVVNTRTGTRALRTGDRVRVDGTEGSVEVLERTPA